MSTITAGPVRFAPPKVLTSEDQQSRALMLSQLRSGNMQQPVIVREDGEVVRTTPLFRQPVLTKSITTRLRQELARRVTVVQQRRFEEEKAPLATILAIVPAHNEEDDIAQTIESLLMQTRPINRIVIMVNNSTDKSFEIASRYADAFPQLIVENEHDIQNGKVGALNWVWQKYASHNQFSFVLGVDADVESDPEMVQHLEAELIKKSKAAGVMARYSFRIPAEAKRRERRLISSQRQEFGMVAIKQQLRGGRSDILGGQATLFRSDALVAAARETDGGSPWNPESAVEDAELTRVFQRLGYSTAVSAKARAWVGPMYSSYAWHKQRMKWEGGHLSDMLRDFHPVQDRRRWLAQADIGWNLLIRVLFAAMLVTSISLDKYTFNPLWLIPIGLSIFQSVLVASKLPDRRAGEVFRALAFFPGELYLWKTLAVWVASVTKTFFDIRHNLWERQYDAEAAGKKSSVSAWMTILLAVTVPVVAMNLLAGVISSHHMDIVLTVGWWSLTFMTVFSVLWMVVWTFRILRRITSLAP